MDNNTAILNQLFEHIFDVGAFLLRNCGVDDENIFVHGRAVRPVEFNRLMTAIGSLPGLAERFEKIKIITPVDIAPFLPAQSSLRHRVAISPTRTAQSGKKPSHAVSFELHQRGLLGVAEQFNRAGQKYSLAVSVDDGSGTARVVADRAGSDYYRISNLNLLAPGQCFAYHCGQNSQLARSTLSLCQNIHNISAPRTDEPYYQETLTNTFVNLFEQAHRHHHLLSCPVDCGQSGGTGKDLARAIHAARIEFLNSKGIKAPGIILVGTSGSDDQKTRDEFLREWETLNKPSVFPTKEPHQARALPQARLNGNSSKRHVLIPGLLNVQMHAEGGMFGVAREMAKKGERFALVNAANGQMQHIGGIARQFSRDLGPTFDAATQAQPTATGQCLTVGAYAYGTDPNLGLLGCENIHNVVAPQKGDRDYAALFCETFVNLLVNASKHGNTNVISCFFGCAIFGGTGTALANALHAAYKDSRVQSLARIPCLSLVGWSNSSSDWIVHDSFIKQFKHQSSHSPLSTPPSASGISSLKMSRLKLSEDAATVKPEEVTEVAASSNAEVITCGICLESKSQTDSQNINDMPVCSECTESYQASGVNIDKFAALPEEFSAIRYDPLEITRSSQPLPGHPGVGRIMVNIKASAPKQLSNGKEVWLTRKEEQHYLPDNPVGQELLRLLKVLHEHQLIFKIDYSNTHGQYGITFNFHLKTRSSGGETCHGYPDPNYPARAVNEIAGLAHTYKLEKELDVSRLFELIGRGDNSEFAATLPGSGIT